MKDWRISEKAAQSPQDAAEQAQGWINELKPQVLVIEKIGATSRKGAKTKAIIGAIARTAAHNYLLDVAVKRAQTFRNKYEEAEVLADRYPEVGAWLPKKRRFFDHEPRNIVFLKPCLFRSRSCTAPPPIWPRRRDDSLMRSSRAPCPSDEPDLTRVSIPEQNGSVNRWDSPQFLGSVRRLGACAPT